MLRVGLTGGTGAGKSTVAARLASLGAVVVDADRLAREVVRPGSEGLAAVAAEFGPGVLAADGALDRPALAALVFADADRRRALEAITHPLIAARTGELLRRAPVDSVVVHDVPLLVEKRMGAGYHLVVVVDAPEEVRVARLAGRGMSPDDARARVRAQASDADRRAAADVLLDNAGELSDVHASVQALWQDRLVPFEENVRQRREVRRPDVVRLVDFDPAWPAQAARLAARVATAAAERGGGVEHVGSTAVPGLLAKDVVDLQLAVRSLADADAVADALAQAGFPRLPGEWVDAPKGGDALDQPKRLHGGADPGRVVHLHVREDGSPAWRWSLLFRDWLRAVPAARHSYAAEKQRLAELHPRTSDYAAAKEVWFARADEQAETWATATGWTPPRASRRLG